MSLNKKEVIVIGSGFSGLSAACFLARDGYQVKILEKNASIGGRARKFESNGFSFDMGPSWYWMPDIFDRFFNSFGKSTSDYYELIRLDPSYRVWWNEANYWDIPANMEALYKLFEEEEPGSATKLKQFLLEAEYKYRTGIGKFVHMPGKSLLEYADIEVLSAAFKMHLFNNMASYVRKYFKTPKIISLLEFPVLFLGAMPKNTPALYSLMNYTDMALGTWYPKGGIFKIVDAMESLAKSLGVEIITDAEVQHLNVETEHITKVISTKGHFNCDVVIGSADYHHIDTQLLPAAYRQYTDGYWESRKMAPSSLLYYVGVNKKLPGLLHHNLFFDTDFGLHSQQIYERPQWPTHPLFYVSVTSKTDVTVAPEGHENLFILIPTAPGLIDTDEIQEKYFDMVLNRLEKLTGESFRDNIVFRRNFAARDFIKDYHALKGNAYGLANTLMQTGPLKPALRHKKIKNMFFAGQLTVPGPGVPPSIISGELAAKEVALCLGKLRK